MVVAFLDHGKNWYSILHTFDNDGLLLSTEFYRASEIDDESSSVAKASEMLSDIQLV